MQKYCTSIFAKFVCYIMQCNATAKSNLANSILTFWPLTPHTGCSCYSLTFPFRSWPSFFSCHAIFILFPLRLWPILYLRAAPVTDRFDFDLCWPKNSWLTEPLSAKLTTAGSPPTELTTGYAFTCILFVVTYYRLPSLPYLLDTLSLPMLGSFLENLVLWSESFGLQGSFWQTGS